MVHTAARTPSGKFGYSDTIVNDSPGVLPKNKEPPDNLLT